MRTDPVTLPPDLARWSRFLLLLCVLWPFAAASQGALITPIEETPRLSARQATLISVLESDPSSSAVEIVRARPDLLVPARLGDTPEADALETLRVMPGIVLRRTEAAIRANGSVSWAGRETRDDGGYGASGQFVVRGEGVTGTFHDTDGLRYHLWPLTGGLHALVRLDPRGFAPAHPPGWNEAARLPSSPHHRGGPGDDTRDEPPILGVVVPYTAVVAEAVADPVALAQLSVDQANESFRNTGLHLRLALTHTYQTDLPETGDIGQDLLRIRSPEDGYGDEVRALRYENDGDLVVVLGSSAGAYGFCGLASSIGSLQLRDSFAVVAYDCSTASITFAHEVGHLLGARHNPENDGADVPFAYGHGTTNTEADFRTVMALNRPECPEGRCRKVLAWSSPDAAFEGVPTGDAELRDNARVLLETGPLFTDLMSGGGLPRFGVSDSALAVTVASGNERAVTLSVSNAGGNYLRWDVATKFETAFSSVAGGLPTERRYGHLGWRELDTFQWLRPVITHQTTSRGALLNLPFDFPFFGDRYSQLYVDRRRGTVTLVGGQNTPAGRSGFGQQVPLPFIGAPVVVPFQTTFEQTPPGEMRWGSFPWSGFMVQWTGTPSNETPHTLQAVLSANGTFTFSYLDVDPGTDHPVLIGFQTADDGGGLSIDSDDWTVRDSVSVRFEGAIPWMAVEADPTHLAADEAQPVTVRFDARRLLPGEYSGVITLVSTVGGTSSLDVPVTLTVQSPTTATEAETPRWTRLLPPAPNPARGIVRLGVEMDRPREGVVSVFDSLGREVARLLDGRLPAGQKWIEWDASRVAPGVYVVRLTTTEGTETQRVTVLR